MCSVLTTVFAVVSEWAHWRGIQLLRYLDDWLVVAESIPFLFQHREQLLVIITSWEKSDLEPSSRAQHLGMLINTVWERVYPADSQIIKFQDLVDKFLFLPSPRECSSRSWGHMASLERFIPWGRAGMHPLWCQLKACQSPAADDLFMPVPLTPDCVACLRWWPEGERWSSGVPPQVHPPSLSFYSSMPLLKGWGTHLLNLTTAEIWCREEEQLHINVLEMKAVHLAPDAFLDLVVGESVVLMSDDTAVAAYLKKRGHSVNGVARDGEGDRPFVGASLRCACGRGIFLGRRML